MCPQWWLQLQTLLCAITTCHQTSSWCWHLKHCSQPHYHSLLNHLFYKHFCLLWWHFHHAFIHLTARCWANMSVVEWKDIWRDLKMRILKCWRILLKIFQGEGMEQSKQKHIQCHEESACQQVMNQLSWSLSAERCVGMVTQLSEWVSIQYTRHLLHD